MADPDSSDSSVSRAELRRRPVVAAGVVLLLILVAGLIGAVVGVISQQQAVEAARTEAARVERNAERTADVRVSAVKDEVASREQAVASRSNELDQRKAALDQQQHDLDARIAGLKATSFGDGIWRVGSDIQPGTYRAIDTQGCYWERMRDFTGGLNSILANDNVSGPAVVTIAASDAGFKSEGCGTWTKVG